jgi:hypothetical protein
MSRLSKLISSGTSGRTISTTNLIVDPGVGTSTGMVPKDWKVRSPKLNVNRDFRGANGILFSAQYALAWAYPITYILAPVSITAP